jgi:hypothetical protein
MQQCHPLDSGLQGEALIECAWALLSHQRRLDLLPLRIIEALMITSAPSHLD